MTLVTITEDLWGQPEGVSEYIAHTVCSLSLTLTHIHTLLIQYFYPFWSFLCWLLIDFKRFSSLNSSLAFPLLNSVCTVIPPHTYTISPLHTNFQRCEHVFHQCQREWNGSLPSVSYCWRSFSSAISHLLSLLQWVTFLACSLDASPCVPAVVPYYCTFKVLHFKDVFFIFLCFFNVLFVWKVL